MAASQGAAEFLFGFVADVSQIRAAASYPFSFIHSWKDEIFMFRLNRNVGVSIRAKPSAICPTDLSNCPFLRAADGLLTISDPDPRGWVVLGVA